MIPFQTTSAQVIELAAIVTKMAKAGIDSEFIVKAEAIARTDQGAFDLMSLWLESKGAERDEILADLQDTVDDYADAPQAIVEKPYVRFDELDGIANQVAAAKEKLRKIIDQHGGVSAVARLTKIPQPSLSRMLNGVSIPRRSTLYKIAKALHLSETEIVMEWTK